MSPATMPEPRDAKPALRASDADRDHVAKLLADAYSEGRLSPQEHAERIEFVYQAKTVDELRPLVADLPVQFAPPTTEAVGGAQPAAGRVALGSLKGLSNSDAQVVAVFGEAKRNGRWLVRHGLHARALFGTVELDLTEAVLEQREIVIVANAVFGEVKLRVPEGVVVYDEGSSVFGSRKTSTGSVPLSPDTPVIRLQGTALFGNVEVKRPKRKWLKF